MRRRLYLVLPRACDARRLASELAGAGVEVAPLGPSRVPPRPVDRRRAQGLRAVGDALWFLNLLLFFTALSGLLPALYLARGDWAVAAGALALASVGLGGALAIHLVRARLAAAPVEGGVALVIEGPGGRVGAIERLVARRHPGAVAGSLALPWGLGGRGGAFLAPASYAAGRREPHAQDLSPGRRADGPPPDHPGRGRRRPA